VARSLVIAGLAACGLLFAPQAHAQPSAKREMPDYDGRGEPPTTAGDVALWVPRVAFSPFYFVSEYVIRRPLAWFITTAERNQWPSAIVNFFTFGPDKKAGVVPTALLDFGFKPSVGLYAFWDDLLGEGNHLRLHASTWGEDWLQGSVADRIPVGKDATFDLRVEGVRRPDQVFYGLGPRSLNADRVRYGIDRLQARPVFETTWWRGSRVSVEGGVKHVEFRDKRCCEDAGLGDALREGRFPSPPAFDKGFTSVYQRGELTVDSREPRPTSQTGVRVELEVEQGANVRSSADSWLRYGGSVGGYLDVKNNRTVSASVTTLFVDPLAAGATIPFTEQIVLGGSGPMRGYLYGRLVDRSAAIATLKYRWPIWVFLDGTMQASLGNVFGPQLEDFKTKLLRLSGAVGVESIGGADHTFEFLLGFGSETFDQGASVTSFRLVFGTNRGF
jgi:Omp85 superfamily domain